MPKPTKILDAKLKPMVEKSATNLMSSLRVPGSSLTAQTPSKAFGYFQAGETSRKA